jgi:hypothetical protein
VKARAVIPANIASPRHEASRGGIQGLKAWAPAFAGVTITLLAGVCFAGAGKDGFRFLMSAGGARAAGMGGTAAALGGDAEAAFSNPGSLPFLRVQEVSLSHASRPEGVTEQGLSYAHPLSAGAAAARVFTRSYGDIQGFDVSGGPAPSYAARDTAFSAGYGRLFRGWGGGLVLKQAQESIAGKSAGAFALDLGALAPWRGTPFTFSAGARNLGSKASFNGEKTSLPRLLDAGAGLKMFSGALAAAVELHKPSDGKMTWNAGAELWAYNVVAFRAGLDGSRDAGDGLSLGVGFRLDALRVDYAFVPMGEGLGVSHRMGISFRFGGAAERSYQEGLSLDQRGQHAEAVLKFKEALDADPGHREAARALREAIRELERERGQR